MGMRRDGTRRDELMVYVVPSREGTVFELVEDKTQKETFRWRLLKTRQSKIQQRQNTRCDTK